MLLKQLFTESQLGGNKMNVTVFALKNHAMYGFDLRDLMSQYKGEKASYFNHLLYLASTQSWTHY